MISDSTIIAAFFWPFSRADIACMLKTPHTAIGRVWEKAQSDGRLPNIKRPAKGFDLRGLVFLTGRMAA